jgi:nucleoside-diphosphate-sugar epimerase
MGRVAFITSGNGITGSAITEYLAQNTTSEQWSKIIVTSRSTFQSPLTDPRITFLALDFSSPVSTLAKQMSQHCSEVTHAYFSSYIHKDDFTELNIANSSLLENFLGALQQTAPRLENVTLQTGGKHYNVHLGPVPSPCRESDPRRTASADNFYFPQEDCLISAQKGQNWTWNVVRPEAIIGWTVKPNGMSSAMTFALYFLICRELGLEAAMPTNQRYWEGYDDVSSARLIADLSVFVSMNPRCANEAFNVTNGDYFEWRYMWPRLAAYFGTESTADQKFVKPRPEEGRCSLRAALRSGRRISGRCGIAYVMERICPVRRGHLTVGRGRFRIGSFRGRGVRR